MPIDYEKKHTKWLPVFAPQCIRTVTTKNSVSPLLAHSPIHT